MITIRLYVILI